MKKFLKYFAFFIGLFAVFYNLTLIYVDKNLPNKLSQINKKVFSDCHKIWSSRGIYRSKAEQNSIISFKRAIKAGYIGFEVDVYYDKNGDRFIISHGRPKSLDGDFLTLEKLFEALGSSKYYFWLDYKNLDRLGKEATLKSIKKLDEILKKYNLKEHLYIEGSNPLTLNIYAKNGFKTLMGFYPLPQTNILGSLLSNTYKLLYYFSDVTALSVQYGKEKNPKYSKILQKNLKGIPQFLFHVPVNKVLIKDLYKKDDVRVMLVGRDQSVSMAYLNCQ